ncbi:MAG: DegT/DnrJ/EryC1/StrS family aminotransferase [Nitrospirae bacterium]|nr:DegT/DnrJ/EryC1/StrS family aminotransferase [Nitrospirota bacterium]
MEIPFHKPYITEDEITGVLDSLRSGWITMGPKTMEFEKMFGAYIGSRNAVSMNSCTAGLHLALKMIDLSEGDEVIVPTITFTATAEVIAYFRAIPVLVDVDEETCNIDVTKIEEKITPRTKAVIPVHFGGQPCDMDEIADIAERHDLLVVEDAAHAIPAWYKNRTIGTISDMTCFSFYATKTLATGEGGMVTTRNDAWAERMKILRLHGISKDAWKRYTKEGSWFYEVIEAGYKYNMTDIQAALGLAQLRKVEWMWKRRREIAGRYTKALAACEAVSLPSVKPDRESAWHLYTVRLDPERVPGGRDLFIDELRNMGVSTSVHFIPLYRHPYYRTAYGYDRSAFPVSEKIFERTVSLPLYPGMTDGEADWVAQSVEEAVRRCS